MQRSKLAFDATEQSYSEFRQACKSKATLKSYTECVNRFMRHCGYTSYDELVKTNPTKIRAHFSNFFSYMRDRFDLGEIRSAYFRPHISGLELFLVQNDVEIDLRKFKKRIPDKEQITGDQPYTTEEIQDMIKQADLRGTPLLSSLSLLNYVDMNSESEVLGYGISLILLNVGMYFVLPAIVIHRIRKFVC